MERVQRGPSRVGGQFVRYSQRLLGPAGRTGRRTSVSQVGGVCHNDRRRDGGVNLLGDRGPIYSHSYWTLIMREQIVDGRNGLGGHRPRTIGSSASPLMRLIDGSHYDAKLSELEVKTIRLWIETSATYPGTYASLGCGFYPVRLPQGEMAARCASCHVKEVGKRRELRFGEAQGKRIEPLVNISRPE